jgi:phage tail sheath protein FI
LFNLVCVPGLTDVDATAMLQAYARTRGAFLIADCGANETSTTVVASLAGKTGADAAHSALFFPWVIAPDPAQSNTPRAFPPCGFVAGVFARTDMQRGVWRASAGNGASLMGVRGLAIHVDEVTQQQLNPHAVNCLRSFPGTGAVVFGSRTLDGDDSRASDWKYIPIRRMATFIERSVLSSIQWARFEPNDEPLWANLRLAVGNFMHMLFKQGALQGNTPALAYFVKCDHTTTTQADIDRGVVNIVIGFAGLRPGEFIILTTAQHVGGSS